VSTGSVMPCKHHRISYYDIASDLDNTVICLGVTVLTFTLSAYFTLNKEHLNPRFVHELADKLVVRQCHGQGISYEEEEDKIDYGLHNTSSCSSWHKQRSKLLHMVNGEHVSIVTRRLHPSSAVKWYEDPSILYEEQANVINNHSVSISGLLPVSDQTVVHPTLTNANLYVHTILPMASQKVAKENNHEVVAMVMSTPSTVMVYYGERGSIADTTTIGVTEIIVCALDSKEYSNCK